MSIKSKRLGAEEQVGVVPVRENPAQILPRKKSPAPATNFVASAPEASDLTNDLGEDATAPRKNISRSAGLDSALSHLQGGMSDLEILRSLRETLGCAPVQARRYLERAYAELTKHAAVRTRSEQRARAIEQRERIIQTAMANEDFRIALSALDSRDKILGVADEENEDALTRTLLDIANLARGGKNLTEEPPAESAEYII